MKSLRHVPAALSPILILGLYVSSGNASAQTLQALNFERVVALTNILTTITPQASPSALAGLTSGALEIHELTIYNAQTNSVTETAFVLPSGSPVPTPLAGITPANVVAQFTVSIANIYITSLPYPAVTIVGNISSSSATAYGNYQGGTASISAAYTTGSSPTITNVAVVVSGAVLDWSAKATGTLTVSAASTGGGGTGGGGTGTAPVVVVKGPGVTLGLEARLDASGSTDPGGLALTYAWKSVGPPTASILSPTAAATEVQFNSGAGTYNFSVTVTDSAGNSATGTVTVLYLGR